MDSNTQESLVHVKPVCVTDGTEMVRFFDTARLFHRHHRLAKHETCLVRLC